MKLVINGPIDDSQHTRISLFRKDCSGWVGATKIQYRCWYQLISIINKSIDEEGTLRGISSGK